MAGFSPFIPLVKQVANKVKRADPGLKVPDWYQGREVPKPTGKFNPGSAEEKSSKGGVRPGGVPGWYEKQEVAKPDGKFNTGGYEDQPVNDQDPWGAYYFSLEIDNVEVAQFLECSGLKTAAEVFEIEEGGRIANVHKRPGRSKWENVVLKRGVWKSHLFAEWRDYYLQPPTDGWTRRAEASAAIVQRDNHGDELRRYSILQPWPVSWEGPALNSGGSDLATETLEIAHEGIILGKPEPKPQPQPQPKPKEPLKPVNFEFDKTEYTPGGKKAMEENVKQINEDPAAKQYYVEGHTCDIGSHGYNLKLSKERALTAANDLKNQTNDNYDYDGFSYDHPVRPNKNEANRAQNRRCQIWEEPRTGDRPGEIPYKKY